MTRMENNYRAWLIKGLRQPSRFLFPNADWFSNFYPRPGMEITPTGNFLQNWAFRFANGAINFNDDGTISGSQLSISNSFEDKAFGSSICSGCLENIPGSRPFEQKCNASLGDGETLYTASAKYKTDWMALWTLNGRDSPDMWTSGDSYRYGHEYRLLQGESLSGIAKRFGTTIGELVDLNYNTITHINNPLRLVAGDIICVTPDWANMMDQMGSPICPASQ
mmetsp:Transcript_55231/g.115539  ORF Transcript_55231/g.115539 Transcript_55231/m.115539 type:complete len:222 (-) Transcript_55231:409-1074(-)